MTAVSSKAMQSIDNAKPPWALPDEPFEASKGDWRTKAKHDVDEIVYGHPFRKLAQKTQVVTQPPDETFRTRKSHTLEVAQIADNFSDQLQLNKDATRAIAYGHDLGHAPIAHIGEVTLKRLLQDYVKKTVHAVVGKRAGEDKIFKAFEFTHPTNSRRILLRKTKKVTKTTLLSVVGHSWSPWKDINTCTSLLKVERQLEKPLEKAVRQFLPCYEAQAVALSDQIAGLNSDIEDLITINGGKTETLRECTRETLDNLSVPHHEKVWNILDTWVPKDGTSTATAKRGWGRKQRFHTIVSSIVKASEPLVTKCSSSDRAFESPLRPAPEVAVALNVLERATRREVYTHPLIRIRDALPCKKHLWSTSTADLKMKNPANTLTS
jgi:dGTP triphosphohydrolase